MCGHVVFMFAILMAQDASTKERGARGVDAQARARTARLLLLFIGLLVCSWCAWNSAREGFAQLRAGYGLTTARLDEADRAVELNPATPEAHYARASLLYDRGELEEAAKEFEEATALRPRDFALWLELGRAREQAGDAEGALRAFRESVRLAPFYAQPRWQLGNTLYRMGRRDEAFAELQRAASSDPKLLPLVLDLSWAAFGDDTIAIERVINAQTPAAHLALARFFLRHGKLGEGLDQFRAAGHAISEDERRSLLNELLAAHRFAAAYEVWKSAGWALGDKISPNGGEVVNGGFEDPVSLNEPGFGWQLPQGLQGVQAAQDTAAPRSGERSLQLNWNGNPDNGTPFLSQLVRIAPNSRYELRFAARTEKIVTVGLPSLIVTETDKSGKIITLGKPVTLPEGTSEWRDYSIEFVTGKESEAVIISVSRESCQGQPCPIFGRVWLDDFSLRRVSQ
jgi:Flp pilus assembly protein TadD